MVSVIEIEAFVCSCCAVHLTIGVFQFTLISLGFRTVLSMAYFHNHIFLDIFLAKRIIDDLNTHLLACLRHLLKLSFHFIFKFFVASNSG